MTVFVHKISDPLGFALLYASSERCMTMNCVEGLDASAPDFEVKCDNAEEYIFARAVAGSLIPSEERARFILNETELDHLPSDEGRIIFLGPEFQSIEDIKHIKPLIARSAAVVVVSSVYHHLFKSRRLLSPSPFRIEYEMMKVCRHLNKPILYIKTPMIFGPLSSGFPAFLASLKERRHWFWLPKSLSPNGRLRLLFSLQFPSLFSGILSHISTHRALRAWICPPPGPTLIEIAEAQDLSRESLLRRIRAISLIEDPLWWISEEMRQAIASHRARDEFDAFPKVGTFVEELNDERGIPIMLNDALTNASEVDAELSCDWSYATQLTRRITAEMVEKYKQHIERLPASPSYLTQQINRWDATIRAIRAWIAGQIK